MKPLAIALLASAAFASPTFAQSTWRQHSGASQFQDVVARSVGDVLTIVIQENHQVTRNEQTTLERDNSLNAEITRFDISPKTFSTLPTVEATAEREFDGNAQYQKQGQFTATLTALVVDVLPNGNLVVEGHRTIQTDGEVKRIAITGIVRPADVTGTNTVQSERVANAHIEFEGDGPLSSTTERGWFWTLLDSIFPF
ncbi:MAG: flagellar basal body L-ring protein FlgH [Planctomycetota bacterium]